MRKNLNMGDDLPYIYYKNSSKLEREKYHNRVYGLEGNLIQGCDPAL